MSPAHPGAGYPWHGAHCPGPRCWDAPAARASQLWSSFWRCPQTHRGGSKRPRATSRGPPQHGTGDGLFVTCRSPGCLGQEPSGRPGCARQRLDPARSCTEQRRPAASGHGRWVRASTLQNSWGCSGHAGTQFPAVPPASPVPSTGRRAGVHPVTASPLLPLSAGRKLLKMGAMESWPL